MKWVLTTLCSCVLSMVASREAFSEPVTDPVGELKAQIKKLQERETDLMIQLANAEAALRICQARPKVEEAKAKRIALDASIRACQMSRVCSVFGQCGFEEGHGCRPTKAAHCTGSEICKLMGRCTMPVDDDSEVCVVRSNADCHRSWACRGEGKCRADLDAGACDY